VGGVERDSAFVTDHTAATGTNEGGEENTLNSRKIDGFMGFIAEGRIL